MAPEKKNPVLIVVALLVFLPILALSKMRGVGHGGSSASGADASSGFSPILIIVILLVVVAFALAGSYLLKK